MNHPNTPQRLEPEQCLESLSADGLLEYVFNTYAKVS